jgi:hypothetical protein
MRERKGSMTTTKKVPREQWQDVLDRFTKRYLRDDLPEAITIDHLSPELGDQVAVEEARLLGITYDPKSNVLEVLLHDVDHLVFQPKELSVAEEEEGFLAWIEIVRDDDTKEILKIRRKHLPTLREE